MHFAIVFLIFLWLTNPLAGLTATTLAAGIAWYNRDPTTTARFTPSSLDNYEPMNTPYKSEPEPDFEPSIPNPLEQLGNQFMSQADKKIYMKSPEWQKLKQARLAIANNTCEVAGCTEQHNLALHHTDYSQLGDESIEHVAILCDTHHQAKHDELGYDRTTLYPIN